MRFPMGYLESPQGTGKKFWREALENHYLDGKSVIVSYRIAPSSLARRSVLVSPQFRRKNLGHRGRIACGYTE